jgi:hypothetical protein
MALLVRKTDVFWRIEPWDMLFLCFSNSILAALLAEEVADLEECRDLTGEDVLGVEDVVAA